MALGVAGVRASEGAWVETAGLMGLAAGLICLRVADNKPQYKSYAWLCFAVTAIAMVIVFWRKF
jgi:hypothetical protein